MYQKKSNEMKIKIKVYKCTVLDKAARGAGRFKHL